MLKVTLLNGNTLWLNPHQIQWVESCPDTIITLVSGEKLLVCNPVDQLVNAFFEFERSIRTGASLLGVNAGSGVV